MRTVRLAAVCSADALRTIDEVQRMHAVNADEQHVTNAVIAVLRARDRNDRCRQQHGACDCYNRFLAFAYHQNILLSELVLVLHFAAIIGRKPRLKPTREMRAQSAARYRTANEHVTDGLSQSITPPGL